MARQNISCAECSRSPRILTNTAITVSRIAPADTNRMARSLAGSSAHLSWRAVRAGLAFKRIFSGLMFEFGFEPAHAGQREHTKIAHQRPDRIPKRGRAVPFDEQMRIPRQTIPGHRRGREKPEIARPGQKHDEDKRHRGADNVQKPCRRMAMFRQVIRPELIECIEVASIRHDDRIRLSKRYFH